MMRTFRTNVAAALTICALAPAQGTTEIREQVEKELASYYESGTVPDYPRAIQALQHGDPRGRKWGGQYLHILLDRSLKDRYAGKIPRAKSPDEEVPRPRIGYEDLRRHIG